MMIRGLIEALCESLVQYASLLRPTVICAAIKLIHGVESFADGFEVDYVVPAKAGIQSYK